MQAQVLDSMELERERGITIKAASVTLYYTHPNGQEYQLNFIDTPGHVDFSYEVSRSLAACEGALLVVDAAQGVEAQSVANCYTAIEQGLEVLPVLNKIDLPQAEPERVIHEIEEIIGIEATHAPTCSAKTGLGVESVLETLVDIIPAPQGDRDAPLQALIIDSWFDNYLGVVSLVRIKQGRVRKGYALTPVMKVGDWSPQSLACGQATGIAGHFVVINQATTNDINHEYHGKGSLSDEPVLLNLNGTFTSETLKAKIYALLKQDQVKISKVIGANAIFTDEK